MPEFTDVFDAPRLLLCHKQKSSARLRFLNFPKGLLAFAPLPADCRIHSETIGNRIHIHHAAWVRSATERLELSPDTLRAEVDFHASARLGERHIPILLACFTTIDPPFAMAHQQGARFIAITEACAATGAIAHGLRVSDRLMTFVAFATSLR